MKLGYALVLDPWKEVVALRFTGSMPGLCSLRGRPSKRRYCESRLLLTINSNRLADLIITESRQTSRHRVDFYG